MTVLEIKVELVLHLFLTIAFISIELFLYVLHLTEFINGDCQKLHIHIQRIPIENIPEDAELFKQWLSDQFVEKERWVKWEVKLSKDYWYVGVSRTQYCWHYSLELVNNAHNRLWSMSELHSFTFRWSEVRLLMPWPHHDQQLILLQDWICVFSLAAVRKLQVSGKPLDFLIWNFLCGLFQLNFNSGNPEVKLSQVLGNRFHRFYTAEYLFK